MQRSSLIGRLSSSIAFTMLGFVCAAACAASQAGPRYVEAAQAAAEYKAEAQNLELAPGWTWPNDPGYRKTNPDGSKNMYEVNAGRVDAAWFWHCSWARTFLNAPSTPEKDAAFAQVLKLPDSAFYRWGLTEKDRNARDQVLNEARAGNIRKLSDIINLNCPRQSP